MLSFKSNKMIIWGIIYLIQPGELVGTNRYKFGCSSKIFKCEKCNKIFGSNFNYQRHLNKKNPCNMIKKFKCNNCLKYFSTKQSLNHHINNRKTICIPFLQTENKLLKQENLMLQQILNK
jgi:uncharacterized C2H2 Zn-finger protein